MGAKLLRGDDSQQHCLAQVISWRNAERLIMD